MFRSEARCNASKNTQAIVDGQQGQATACPRHTHPHLVNMKFMYYSQVYSEKPLHRPFSTPMAAAVWPGLPGGPYAIGNECHDCTPSTLLFPLSHCSIPFILTRSATLSRTLPLTVLLVTLLFLAPIVFPCI